MSMEKSMGSVSNGTYLRVNINSIQSLVGSALLSRFRVQTRHFKRYALLPARHCEN